MNSRCGGLTRFDAVRQAVLAQIDQMSKGAEQRKVGILTFDKKLTVIGDGSSAPQVIAGKELLDFNYLKQNGKAQAYERLDKTLKES